MSSKAEYEKRKAERNARREHLNERDQQNIDMENQIDRLVTAFERIADALVGIEINMRRGPSND